MLSSPEDPGPRTESSFKVALRNLNIDKSVPPNELIRIMEFQRTSLSTDLPNFEQLVLELELQPGTTYSLALSDGSDFPPMLCWVSSRNATFVTDGAGALGLDQLANNQSQSAPVRLYVAPSAESLPERVECLLKFYYDPQEHTKPFSSGEVIVTPLPADSGDHQ
jgi:hypothetical protein